MGKKGPLWWRESDWLLRGSSAANQILLRPSGPILSIGIIAILVHFKKTLRTVSFEVATDLLWEFLHESSQMNKLYLKQGMFHRLC